MSQRLPTLLLALCACSGPAGDRGARDVAGDTSPATRRQLPPAGRDDARPAEARQATLAAFARYDVVALGVLSYADRDLNAFILDLIRDPAFPDRVNDIAVECGNARYQAVLDRYVRGDSVPLSEVRQVWRNTTQPMCGVTAFHEALFPLVRRVNQKLPAERRLRVLACDPPVDWSAVKGPADLRRFGDRDASIAAVMEREVFAKHRKALMIFGVRHLLHGGGGAVRMYERSGHPGATFVVMAHNGFAGDAPRRARNDELEGRMAAWPVPSLVTLHGTWVADLDLSDLLPGEDRGRHLGSAVDGYLYLGPRDLVLREPIPASVLLDTSYVAELRRRARVRQGPTSPDAIVREAADPDAFFNQEGGRATPRRRD